MKTCDVKHDSVPDLPTQITIDRWQLRVLGFHVVTVYRYDIVLPKGDQTSQWWFYACPLDHLGIGCSPPDWLVRRLGLWRTYTKTDDNKATNT